VTGVQTCALPILVWFAATGYCIITNGLYWLGAEPRLKPEPQAPPASTDARELVPR